MMGLTVIFSCVYLDHIYSPLPLLSCPPPTSPALFPMSLSFYWKALYSVCDTVHFIRVVYRSMGTFPALTLLQQACFPINCELHIDPPRRVGSCEPFLLS